MHKSNKVTPNLYGELIRSPPPLIPTKNIVYGLYVYESERLVCLRITQLYFQLTSKTVSSKTKKGVGVLWV